MELTPYVENLRRQLLVAAEPGGEEASALAQRLVAALDPAARLTLLDVLGAAADEITRELAPGSVEVRLRGRDPGFVVTPPPFGAGPDSAEGPPVSVGPSLPTAPSGGPEGEDMTMVRINLRLSEHLKGRVESAADREGLSVNAWLVRAAAAALDRGSSGRHEERRAPRGGERFTGWVR